ncbi:HAD-like protein [Hypomontagnella submonticulosa]|nr:HAD-like protein [Hypomontagnella submonticulosa]
MVTPKPPKVLLFDIGGVCVISPFQSILDYELSLGIPPGWINYSLSKTAPSGFWHRLERGEISLDDAFYAGFSRDLHDPVRWNAFYTLQRSKNPDLAREIPPVPKLDGKWLFNDMMTSSTSPDPWMYPALKNLKASGKFILAALSNTVIFPPGHALHREDFLTDPLRSLFDVFVSSAHVGLRKPDPKIYEYALKEVDKYARTHADEERGRLLGWHDGVKPDEIVFLDDIGENLKAAKKSGFRTIKVPLGKAFEAVDQLEALTGLKLAGDHPRIPIKPDLKGSNAKL